MEEEEEEEVPTGRSAIDKIKGGTCSDAQFKLLTKEEKDRVAQQYRGEAQKKKKNNNKMWKQKADKRRLAKAQSVLDE
jgi:hypothetical protein